MKTRLQSLTKHCRLQLNQAFYTQRVCLPVASVSKMDQTIQNCFWHEFLELFSLTKQGTRLKTAWCTWNSFWCKHFSCLIRVGWVGIHFAGVWLWITMPARRKLSNLNHDRTLARLNDGVRNCCEMIEINLPLSKLPVDFVVCMWLTQGPA